VYLTHNILAAMSIAITNVCLIYHRQKNFYVMTLFHTMPKTPKILGTALSLSSLIFTALAIIASQTLKSLNMEKFVVARNKKVRNCILDVLSLFCLFIFNIRL